MKLNPNEADKLVVAKDNIDRRVAAMLRAGQSWSTSEWALAGAELTKEAYQLANIALEISNVAVIKLTNSQE